MFPFIVCFCGRSIGDLYDAFKHMRQKIYMEKLAGIAPEMVAITEVEDVSLKEVLDQLGLHMTCCRTHILTQTEFKTYY